MDTEEPLQKNEAINLELDIPLELLQHLHSEGSNLQSICRLCLSASNDALLPFTFSESSIPEEIFQALTSVYINSNDALPIGICPKCKLQLDHSYKFRRKCGKSDYLLRSLLKERFPVKIEPINIIDNVETEEEIKNIMNIEIKEETIEDDKSKGEEVFNEYTSNGLVNEVYNNYAESNSYHEDLKSIINDDEALFIVQDTLDNEKKFTIYERHSDVFTDMIFTKSRKKKTSNFKCMFCPQEFRQASQFKAHQKQHIKEHSRTIDNYKFPCMHCKKMFHSEFDLSLHNIIHKKGPWKCSSCGKEFKDKSAIRRHIQRHMTSKRFACDACGKTFVELCALTRHARVHTGQGLEKKHACALCDKRFSDNTQLSVHMARHSGSKPFQCVVCGGGFPSARLLRSHRLVHSDLKPHACDYCDKRFRHESTRNTHHRTHTGEKPYVCSICGKNFIQASNMNLHMRTHTGERPYSCTQCDSRFSSGSTLKAHQRTHTGERPFKCKVCGKSFARVSMKQHMRVHSGERPFACSACPKRYMSAAHLRAHCRLHTGEKPYECANCQSKFATKTLLIKHLQVKEKLIKPTKPTRKKQKRETPIVKKETIPEPLQDNDIPNAIVELTLGTHETLDVGEELVFQENGKKTHVIVLDSNTVSIVSNEETEGLNIVTVNEIGIRMSSTDS